MKWIPLALLIATPVLSDSFLPADDSALYVHYDNIGDRGHTLVGIELFAFLKHVKFWFFEDHVIEEEVLIVEERPEPWEVAINFPSSVEKIRRRVTQDQVYYVAMVEDFNQETAESWNEGSSIRRLILTDEGTDLKQKIKLINAARKASVAEKMRMTGQEHVEKYQWKWGQIASGLGAGGLAGYLANGDDDDKDDSISATSSGDFSPIIIGDGSSGDVDDGDSEER